MANDKLQGGSMGGVEDLYREVILDHFKSPKNRGSLPQPSAHAEGKNPLCGDQISISIELDKDKIKDIKFEGHGCAISQSAASMMTELVKGKSLPEVIGLTQAFKTMFGIREKEPTTTPSFTNDDLGDLISLEGVKKYPVRIKCAVLSANTLVESLAPFLKK